MSMSFLTDHFHLLQRWQEYVFESVYAFNQVPDPNRQRGDQVWVQSERERVAKALRTAYLAAWDYLGFPPTPQFFTDRFVRLPESGPYFGVPLDLNMRHIKGFGTKKLVTLAASSGYSASSVDQLFSNYDGDFILEVVYAEVVLPAAHKDADVHRVQLYHTTGNGSPTLGDIHFRIPVRHLERSDSFATDRTLYVGARFLNIIDPQQYRREFIDGSRNALTLGSSTAASTVAVLLETRVEDGAVELISFPESGDTELIKTPCKAVLTDPFTGEFYLAAGDESPPRRPYAVCVNFESGYQLGDDGEIDHDMETAIVAIGNCDHGMAKLPAVREAAAVISDHRERVFENQYALPVSEHPYFGLCRGHIEAEDILKRYADQLLGKAHRWV